MNQPAPFVAFSGETKTTSKNRIRAKKVPLSKNRRPGPTDPRAATGPAAGRRYFYGWNIVAAAFMANLAYAEHYTSILGLFFKPLQAEFGWSRSAIAGVQTVARIVEALVAPLTGPLIDRHGPRLLMPIGGAVVGLAMLGMTQVSRLWQFYALRGVAAAVGFTLMGALVTNVAISNWFVRRRGRALSIARLGNNLSNVIFVPVVVFIIARYGWRSVFLIFAVVTWLTVIIPSALLMRRRPEDLGLQPDGDRAERPAADPPGQSQAEAGAGPASDRPWTRRQVLTTASFWLLAFCMGIDSLALQGLNITLAPYIQDLGYSDTTLAAVMTFRAVAMAAAFPLVAFIAERSRKAFWRLVPFVVQGAGAFLFLLAGEPLLLWLAVILYGLGIAALSVAIEVIWAEYFGRISLGLVRSLAFPAAFGFGAAGPLAMSAVFDLTRSYRLAFILLGTLFGLGAVLMGLVRPPRRSDGAGTDF